MRYEVLLRTSLEKILNITLTENSWTQATLPTKRGGLGIRRVPELALSAFLASATGTISLQNAIIGTESPITTWKILILVQQNLKISPYFR